MDLKLNKEIDKHETRRSNIIAHKQGTKNKADLFIL